MFNKLRQIPGRMGQKTKLAGQMLKIQKQLGRVETEYDQNGIRVVIKGGGFISSPKIKELTIASGAESELIDVLNKALKKSHKRALKKLQAVGGGLQDTMGV